MKVIATVKGLLVVSIIISIALRLVAALMMGNTVDPLPGIFDQISYSTLATRLLSGHGFTFDTSWWPATQANQPTAHWSYLYTLFVTSIYALVGTNPLVARIIQVIATGTLIPLLTWRVAGRVFRGNQVVPLLAAGWTACYGYFIYYSAALMTESFYITGILWTLDCALHLAQRSGEFNPRQMSLRYAELGIAIAFTIVLRQVFLVFVPFLFLWLILVNAHRPVARQSITRVLLYLVATVAVISAAVAPITAWNYYQFNRLVLLNTNSGYAFFWANHPVHGERFVATFTDDMPSYYDLIPTELTTLDEAALDQALMQRGITNVLVDPIRYLKLSISRIPVYFMFWPAVDSSTLSNIVRVVSFGAMLPFALLGLALCLRTCLHKKSASNSADHPPDYRHAWLLLLFVVTYTGVHLASWAGIRYRLPVDAILLIFAAYGLFRLLSLVPAWTRWTGKFY